jgi:hypothetical protein
LAGEPGEDNIQVLNPEPPVFDRRLILKGGAKR